MMKIIYNGSQEKENNSKEEEVNSITKNRKG